MRFSGCIFNLNHIKYPPLSLLCIFITRISFKKLDKDKVRIAKKVPSDVNITVLIIYKTLNGLKFILKNIHEIKLRILAQDFVKINYFEKLRQNYCSF